MFCEGIWLRKGYRLIVAETEPVTSSSDSHRHREGLSSKGGCSEETSLVQSSPPADAWAHAVLRHCDTVTLTCDGR